jgi:hypothetical protein
MALGDRLGHSNIYLFHFPPNLKITEINWFKSFPKNPLKTDWFD